MFRKAEPRDIDAIHQLLVAEAAQGYFDRRLVDEPYRSGRSGDEVAEAGFCAEGAGQSTSADRAFC